MFPPSSRGIGTLPASSPCLEGPSIRQGRAAAVLTAALLFPSPSSADIVRLKDGRTVEMGRCETLQSEIRCERAGGVVGFPLDQIVAIEKQAAPTYRRPLPPPERQEEEVSPLPFDAPIAIDGQPSAEEVRSLIERMSASLSGPGVSESQRASARREIAAMHAYLGSLAALSGDYGEAESRYRRALDHDPSQEEARLSLAAVLITIDRHQAAETILHEILSGNSDDPRALELLGEAAFQTGRTREAIERWEKALEKGARSGLGARLEKARRLLEAEEGFEESDGAHFALRFDGEEASPDLAREILAYLEEARADLSSRLNHYPSAVIRVTLYSRRSFQEVTGSPDWVGGIFDGQVRIPIRGLDHLTPQARRVLIHELTHAFVASKTNGSAPRWIQEGLAQLMEDRSAERERPRLAAEYAAGGHAWAGDFDYPKSLSQVEFLVGSWSRFHLNDLLDHLGRGTDIDGSMRAAIGMSYREFVTSWGIWLAR